MPKEDKPDRAAVQATAYRLLARRDHARQELARKLRQRKLPEELIQDVLDECDRAGYLDDQRFAALQGRILARKGWGPRRIDQKLRERGVDASVISQTLDEISAEVDFQALATERLLSRFGPPERLDDAQRQRAFRHLLHRGYFSALIRHLLFER